MKGKKLLITVVLILCAVFVFAGGDKDEAEKTQEQVVLRVGGLNAVDGWNPWSNNAPFMFGTPLVLEGFTGRGPASDGFSGLPRMADSWEVSEDGLVWTIRLHEGITFSDGTPVTAQTVKDYLDWERNEPLTYGYYSTTTNIESIEVIDDLTFMYTSFEPMIDSEIAEFPMMFILPPHIWSNLGDDLFAFDNSEMIGTGPYVISEHVPGSHIIFDAREDYYRGKPAIDRIIYKVFANNDALVNALISGEIDLTMPYLPPEVYETLGDNPNITFKEKFPFNTFEIAFNMSDYGVGNEAVKDPAVRLAIDQAIDKNQIVDVVFLGHATTGPTNWAVGPYYEGKLNPNLKMTPFDPNAARQTLKDAGYVDSDGDGVREDQNGKSLEFRLIYATDYPTSQTMTRMIADWLADIGIKVDIEAVDFGTWYYYVLGERDFDMAIDLRISEIDPSQMSVWLSSYAAEPGGINTTGAANPEMDDLVYGFMYTVDEDLRWELLFEAQRLLNEERRFILLAGPHQIQAYRNDRFIFQSEVTYIDIDLEGVQVVK